MAFKPTEAQSNAINATAGTLVSAAAGSGKTAVLAERVVRLLTGENPISADRILVVTFMSAAAEEMRSRIERRLNAECSKDPKNKLLYAQKLKIRNAKICTIDSFCIELVRENFDILGVTPDFKVGDDISVNKIKDAALTEILNSEFRDNSTEFIALLNALCSKFDETDLKEAIIRIYEFSQNLPFPREWLENLYSEINNDAFCANIISQAFMKISSLLDSATDKLSKAINGLQNDENLYSIFAPVIEDDLVIYESLKSAADEYDWNKLLVLLNTSSFKRWPSPKNLDCSARLAAKTLRNLAKSDFNGVKSLVYADDSAVIFDIKSALSLVKKLIQLVINYTDAFTAGCIKENFMTFSQAEHYALNLLCESRDGEIVLKDTAYEIIGRFDEILVDEFQDINDMQDLLFNILSQNEKNLFAVGDVKQSIYGFRGSNPINFLNKKNTYLPFAQAAETDLKKIILGNNFRSRNGICSYINFLFEMLMNGEKSSIKYTDEEILVPTARYPENADTETEIHFIDIESNEKTATEFEAQHIADFIKSYLNEKTVTDEQNGELILRKPSYEDFAIILRGVKSKGSVYAQILEENGIPVNFSVDSVYDSSEVKIMLSLLTVIANPTRDIELVSVLMSPLFGFTADELAALKINSRNDSFITAVTNGAVNGNVKAADFLKKLTIYRTAAVTMGIGDLIDYLYEDTEFLNIASALENGSARRENLMSLYTAALDYQDNYASKNILKFVDFIRSQSDTDISTTKSGKENAVKITTIHKSKGLQYPICILADTSKRFAGEDTKKNLLTDVQLGVGFRYFDNALNEKKESLHFKIIKDKMLNMSYEEEMRLAYVAATRAKEKLLIVNTLKNLSDELNTAAALSAVCKDVADYRSIVQNSSSYLDWLLYTSVIHPDFKLCEFETRLIANTNSKVTFKKVSSSALNIDLKSTNKIKDGVGENTLTELIRRNLDYSYPYENVKTIETKSSVAVIAHKADEEEYSFMSLPDFMSASGLSPAKRGTATHRFMQFSDFDAAEKSVQAELDRLYEWEFISAAERDAVDIKAVERFFASDIYTRIKNSVKFEREMRFITEMPAGKLKSLVPETVKDEPVIIQGSVDLVFEEPDGLVIVDFKTDRVRDENVLREAYSEQLNIYGKACEKIFEKPIKELLLYSFSLSDTVEV